LTVSHRSSHTRSPWQRLQKDKKTKHQSHQSTGGAVLCATAGYPIVPSGPMSCEESEYPGKLSPSRGLLSLSSHHVLVANAVYLPGGPPGPETGGNQRAETEREDEGREGGSET
ncbi:hypothetical protein KUCAC02_001345, partial [Chaenocephalus aceratus]